MINEVRLIGRLGQDPETRYMPNGDAVVTLSVATTEQWKDKNSGEKREATEWHRCVAFGKLAEICDEYLEKGSLVFIGGKLKTRKWQDKDGKDRYTTEINFDTMKMLGGKSGEERTREGTGKAPNRPVAARSEGGQGMGSQNGSVSSQGGAFDDLVDDVPFRQHMHGKNCLAI